MAEAALHALKIDEVVFLPTGTTRYRKPAVAGARDRVAMLRLALKDEPRYRIDERELAPGASGYTADTLKSLRAELGEVPLYFLMGADQYENLGTWHRPEEVRSLARIAVFARPGVRVSGDAHVVPMEPSPISASDIRARAKRGEDLSGLVPPAVASYIRQHKVYT
jgi:nicotinate-nucleotide adenylyltransferase